MRKYFTDPKQDPSHESYDPKPQAQRPMYSENKELNDLRLENFDLRKLLSRYMADDPEVSEADMAKMNIKIAVPKEEPPVDDGIDRITDTPVAGLGSGLGFTTKVPATEKSPSGGVISKPKAKAEAQKAAARKKTDAKQPAKANKMPMPG